MLAISLVFLLLATVSAGKHDQYSGYSVHGIKLRTQSDKAFIEELTQSLDLDVWQVGNPESRDAQLMLSPEDRVAVLDDLDKHGLEHYLHVADVAKVLEAHEKEVNQWKQSRSGRLMPFNDYPRYEEVDAYLEQIAAQYPELVTLVNAGQSFEGRDIKYLKISTTNFTDTSKPVYFMDAMMHAREWVTTPVTLFSIHRLVEDLRDLDRDLLEDIDWIILPMTNPDGYEYSHTDVRLWRRTRSINLEVSTECVGVDANRNFDVNWNTTGVSQNPCSDVYPGTAPFSESETRIVRDIIAENLNRMEIFMNIHSHGNWVLYGFGDYTLPDNVIQLHVLSAAMGAAMDALKLPAAEWYKIGNSAMILYTDSGSAADYGQYVGVPFSLTLELPGYGNGFLVPPQYIEHINFETWEGIAVSARLARSFYRARQ
ncbi:carboxypeptidase B-like isoform X1 [Ostrinia furnacalis]|uniref:carboxypeptidase B-like isoform X1 n=1 Tax=Ostrinia furnacalis TaxID=93504 RepID=UPI0010394031|nr:carboxypeptidase B-like isoform X1 [Ostrinia furnacalis]